MTTQKKRKRSKFECPEILAEWLDRLRAVDPKLELPNSTDVYRKHSEENSSWISAYEKAFDECFAPFSEAYKRAIIEDAWIEDAETIEDKFGAHGYALYQYDVFCKMRHHLREIAEFFAYKDWRNMAPDFASIFLSEPSTGSYHAIVRPDSSVKFVASKNPLLEAIPPDVKCERIRICEICSHLFWAKRTKSRTCSHKCLNTLSQRRYWESNREQLNKVRRTNYETKKQNPTIGKKKNGPL